MWWSQSRHIWRSDLVWLFEQALHLILNLPTSSPGEAVCCQKTAQCILLYFVSFQFTKLNVYLQMVLSLLAAQTLRIPCTKFVALRSCHQCSLSSAIIIGFCPTSQVMISMQHRHRGLICGSPSRERSLIPFLNHRGETVGYKIGSKGFVAANSPRPWKQYLVSRILTNRWQVDTSGDNQTLKFGGISGS